LISFRLAQFNPEILMSTKKVLARADEVIE